LSQANYVVSVSAAGAAAPVPVANAMVAGLAAQIDHRAN
jgi:hypothetical protein